MLMLIESEVVVINNLKFTIYYVGNTESLFIWPEE